MGGVGLWRPPSPAGDWEWTRSALPSALLGEGVTMSTVTPAAPATSPAKRDLTRAWVSLGLMVPSFVGLMGFGEWANAEDAPVLAAAMAVVMVALYAVFAAGAVWFGVQARKLGARAGLVPAILAGLGVASILSGQIEYLLNGRG